MASHGIRGTTLAAMRSNVENEAVGPRGKNVAGSELMAAKGRVTRATRTAMTDIGNKANVLQNAKNLNNKGKEYLNFRIEFVNCAAELLKILECDGLMRLVVNLALPLTFKLEEYMLHFSVLFCILAFSVKCRNS